MPTLKYFMALFALALTLTSCQPRPSLTKPLRFESFCKPGHVLNSQRLEEIGASIEDGEYFKGATDIGLLKSEFHEYGGAVGYWLPSDLHFTKFLKGAKTFNLQISGAIAVDDRPHSLPGARIVYMGYRKPSHSETIWLYAASSDLDSVCS